MNAQNKTKEQLTEEVGKLRQQVAEMEACISRYKQTNKEPVPVNGLS